MHVHHSLHHVAAFVHLIPAPHETAWREWAEEETMLRGFLVLRAAWQQQAFGCRLHHVQHITSRVSAGSLTATSTFDKQGAAGGSGGRGNDDRAAEW
jgi:hypothetical protein